MTVQIVETARIHDHGQVSDEPDKSIRGRFQKGQSGNPGGRAKGLERLVRETVGDDMVAIVYVQRCVALGMPPDPDQLKELGVSMTDAQCTAIAKTFAALKPREATEAAKLVSDRGWGKAPQHVTINDRTVMDGDLDDLEDPDLDAEIVRLQQALTGGVH